MQCDAVWFPEESEVRQMSLSDVIGEHLCLYWFAKTSCLDFGFEGLDLVANALEKITEPDAKRYGVICSAFFFAAS